MRYILLMLPFFFSVLNGPSAQAQMSMGGNDDIIVKAQTATYKGKLTILKGSVDVVQGNARILSDIMHIYRESSGPTSAGISLKLGAVTRIEADGNFRYETPDSVVTGDRGVYVQERNLITVTGNVKVVQKSGNTAETDKLFYDVKTETIRFAGNCLGRNCKGRPSLHVKGRN
jgi:lipopolysaccharide export system protein LptA